jgi:hypothetical protein
MGMFTDLRRSDRPPQTQHIHTAGMFTDLRRSLTHMGGVEKHHVGGVRRTALTPVREGSNQEPCAWYV